MVFTGLVLSPVQQGEPLEVHESLSLGTPTKLVRMDNLLPDSVAISAANKKIGILEFCRPSDSFPDHCSLPMTARISNKQL